MLGQAMTVPRLSKLELRIMQVLWESGDCSVREIQEGFPEKHRPAYTTIQTTVYRMEAKNIVERVKKIGNSLIFRPLISQNATQGRLIDELLALFGGRIQPVLAHLAHTRKLTPDDVKEAQKLLQKLAERERSR
jgi:BlaI family transcriptional regulator, penicillinase repressor